MTIKEVFDILTGDYMKPTCTEWCPKCDREVELVSELRVQICPSCGKEILPCNLCNPDVTDCTKCPLESIYEN